MELKLVDRNAALKVFTASGEKEMKSLDIKMISSLGAGSQGRVSIVEIPGL